MSKDVEKLATEFGKDSRYFSQYVQPFEQTPKAEREANMSAMLHGQLASVLNDWLRSKNTPPILDKVRKKLEELDGSYLKPLNYGAKILQAMATRPDRGHR